MNDDISIYNVKQWDATEIYPKNTVVKTFSDDNIDGSTIPTKISYFYSLKEISSPITEHPSQDLENWGGYYGQNGKKIPEFLWKPSYNSSISHVPSIQIAKFGDGYEQRFRSGIYNDYIEMSLTFEHRSSEEAKCINHFLKTRQGEEAFVMKHIPETHQDHEYKKLFVCEKWNSSFVFYNNHTVTALFRQVNS